MYFSLEISRKYKFCTKTESVVCIIALLTNQLCPTPGFVSRNPSLVEITRNLKVISVNYEPQLYQWKIHVGN